MNFPYRFIFQDSIAEETKGVLKRKSNDVPLIKSNSGYRASPRAVAKSASPTSNKVPEPQVGL